MPRLPRLCLGGHVHHVLLRGHNRQPVVQDDEDRQRLLRLLKDCALHNRVAVHAYVLMDEHLHLLVTPESAEGLSLMMQAFGRRYVASFNQRHRRTGTLWEGRFRAALIEAPVHLLACMCFIELNPVRRGITERAEAYPWSSARHHLEGRPDPLVSGHRLLWSLGNTPFEREAAYREMLMQGVSSELVHQIMQATLRGWPLGSDAFLRELGQSLAHPVAPRPRGRPRRTPMVYSTESDSGTN